MKEGSVQMSCQTEMNKATNTAAAAAGIDGRNNKYNDQNARAMVWQPQSLAEHPAVRSMSTPQLRVAVIEACIRDQRFKEMILRMDDYQLEQLRQSYRAALQ